MKRFSTIKDLQIMELAFLSLLSTASLNSYKITFLIKVFDELIECNTLDSSISACDYLDWGKFFNFTKSTTSDESFNSAVSKLLNCKKSLFEFLSNENISNFAYQDKLDPLPSFLYNPVLSDSQLEYDFLKISSDDPIQILSLKISETKN